MKTNLFDSMNKRVGKKGQVGNITGTFGIVLSIFILIVMLAITWPIAGDEIAKVNDSGYTEAYGNLTETFNEVPERTTTIVTVSLVSVILLILIGVYAYFRKFM